MLSSYGAARSFSIVGFNDAELLTEFTGFKDIHEWLISSRQWCTPLHHLDTIDVARARLLLRNGADLHSRFEGRGPSPLSIAKLMYNIRTIDSAANIVIRAAQQWSPDTHDLFPRSSRARAIEMLLIGHRLSHEPRFGTEAMGLFDVWMIIIMPHLISRQ